MRSAREKCDLTLAWSAACAKIIENFRAEGFHRMPALNLSGSTLLYRRLREFQRATWLARSIPATPRKNRRRSLQTAGWRKSGAFLPREVLHQARVCRPLGCARAWPRRLRQQDPGEQQRKKLSCQKKDAQRKTTLPRLAFGFAEATKRTMKILSRRDARQSAASHIFRRQ